MAKALERPRLKSVDDLFGLNGEDTAAEGKLMVVDLDVNNLVPFDGHPFYLYEGERLEDMVESIRTNGVLVPILVRKIDINADNTANRPKIAAAYEILAGHNRVNAVKMIGKATIPAIVLDGITDEEALAYVIETNLMQRSFADMKHSEKAAVIAMHHAKMFSPGKRHDILRILQQMENADGQTGQEENPDKAHDTDNGVTFPQVGERLEQEATDVPDEDEISHTDKKIADMYSLSKNTVSRYLRINQLYSPLKEMLDIGYVPFIPAVTVSFL
jgi:ParB family chromosome partitioning protein